MEIERSRREVAMDTALPYEKKTTEPSHGLMRVINNQSCLRNRMYARGCYALTALVTAFLFYQIASAAIQSTTPRGKTTSFRPRSSVTDDELAQLSEELLRRDANNAANQVQVNPQGHTYGDNQEDLAPQPLLQISPEVWRGPTISLLRPLYDNYIADTTQREIVTAQERAEENAFLDAVAGTAVMRHAATFLKNKELIGRDTRALREVLQHIWFTLYSRGGGRMSSCAFEHVFLGEKQNANDVSGLHNWVFFSTQELTNQLNYMGYVKKIDLNGKGHLLKTHYRWGDRVKPVGSMFVGTSPELEMALYTVCFLARPNEICPLKLAGKSLSIRTHVYRTRGRDLIGSAFPII